jgi:hypothetical protein
MNNNHNNYLSISEKLYIRDVYSNKKIINRRYCNRIKENDIADMFDIKQILVTISTGEDTFVGILVNISSGGSLVTVPCFVEINTNIQINFHLGNREIFVKSKIKHACKNGDNYTIGIVFTDIDQESLEYIDDIICINTLLKDIGDLSIQKISFCCTSQHPCFRKLLNDHGFQRKA